MFTVSLFINIRNTSIWVKINCFPDPLTALALSVKASSNTLDPSVLNKQIPGLALLNISPMVLSSNGTTVGLSFCLIHDSSP